MAKKKKTSVQSGGWQAIARAGGWKEVLRGDTLRFVAGLLSLCASLLMLLSFTSYIFTGNLDQAALEAGCLESPANMCGKVGAYLSYYFMNDCFGVGAYFIPVFLLLLGLKLVKAYRVRLWKSFLHCAFLMVWVSAFLALLSGLLPEAWFAAVPFRPGGRHGAFVTGWLLRETGAVGCWMAMVASAILYLVYLSRKTIDVVRRLLRPQEYLKRRKHPEPGPEAPGAEADPVVPAAPVAEPEEETGPVSLNFGHEAGDDGSTALVLDPVTEETQPDDAAAEYGELRKAFPALPESYDTEAVNDADWQNEYKKYLKPWDCRGLHWVPVWMKGEYRVPESDKALYFDAGMAFGTGDHPTTRLCAMALIDALADNPEDKSVIDAGCGSGILAISAYLLGARKVFGFDRDPEAVKVSIENAEFNAIPKGAIEFVHSGIEMALAGRKADILLANIISDVLCIYADNLIEAVNPGGKLVLSGILAAENDEVKECFASRCKRAKSIESAVMGEWSSLVIEMEK